MTLILALSPLAGAVDGELEAVAAGYGVPVEGYPSLVERQLHLWTNIARVAPDAFDQEYSAGGCSTDDFSEDELTPKAPLYNDLDLTEVSRVQSADMNDNGCFQHESCDGTSFEQRVAGYYDDTSMVGENIAMGSDDPKYSVLSMWMCSTSGHRANIMDGGWNELGPGVKGSYMTQDFGAGELEQGDPPVRMAVDYGGMLWADWGHTDAPAALSVVVEGVETALELQYGTGENGAYGVMEPDFGDETCRSWYAYWRTADGAEGTFPAAGSWRLGDDCEEEWIDVQTPRNGLFGDVEDEELHDEMLADLSLVGCSSVGARPGLGLAGLAGLLLLRRRRG